MNVLIIEDEKAASGRLVAMLNAADPSIAILAVIDSIEDSVTWLMSHDEPDVIFADIQLSDGICFEIFRKVRPRSAVIFTTAYDEYALEAFKVNSVDYLLKPLDPEALAKSLDKYRAMKNIFTRGAADTLASLLSHLDRKEKGYRTRFLVKSGQGMKPVDVGDAAYFTIDSQLVFLVTRDQRRYLVEYTLDDLEKSLDPGQFFRINRQMIVSLESVSAIRPYFNSRLKLDLVPAHAAEVLVSRNKTAEFRNWLER
jgi:two-component system LytT family response regulator